MTQDRPFQTRTRNTDTESSRLQGDAKTSRWPLYEWKGCQAFHTLWWTFMTDVPLSFNVKHFWKSISIWNGFLCHLVYIMPSFSVPLLVCQ